MAVLSRLLVGSQQRIDLPDILAIESYVASDFKHLIKSFVGTTPMILKGFEIIDAPLSIGSTSVSIRVANSVLYNPLSSSGCFFYGLEEGSSFAMPLTPDLRKNATNYIYLVLSSEGSASDSRAFWDVDLNSGEGGEFNQIVNTQSVIKMEVGVSVSSFPEGSVPVAKVELNANSIIKITDCRNMMFRLGTGGSSPDSLNTYAFRSLPSSSYTRDEPSLYVENTTSPTPFFGGDKNIFSLKEWMDVVMTKLLELSGTTYWYESTPTINILNLFDDALGSSIKSKGRWTHDLANPGKIIWSEDIVYRKMNDPRDIIIRSNIDGATLSNDEVMYIDMLRNKQINSLNSPVTFVNSQSYINGSLGSFENLSQGDWIKKSTDNDNLYLRVERFWTGLNKSGSSTTNSSIALSVELSGTYQGTGETSVATYTKGEYTNSDIKVSSRSSSEPWFLGGQFYWLANRSDTIQKISLIRAKDVAANVTKANGKRAIIDFGATPHDLIDGDRIVITDTNGNALSEYGNNPYQIEKQSDTTVIIQTSSKLNYTGIKVRWAVVTTSANYSSASGDTYQLESANHNFESNQKIKISETSSLHDGDYYINYRNNTQFQIPSFAAGDVSTGKATCARVNLRTEFGAAKVIQGESLDINEPDSKNILDFIGMTSLAQSNPVYFLPESTNTLQGVQNFNSEASDSLTARVSKLTAMMADRVQDRGSIIGGRVVFRNTNLDSLSQKIVVNSGSTNSTLFIERPGSPRQTINLDNNFYLNENQAYVIQISRESNTAITPTVEDLIPTSGGRFALEENKIILFYRFSGKSIYTWTGVEINTSASWTSNDHENAQNKNISIIDTASVSLNTAGTTSYLYYRYSSGSVTVKINGSSYDNTIDVSSINAISTNNRALSNGKCVWIRVNRSKQKTFTSVTTNASAEDSDSSGYLYITNTSDVPVDEDVFVIYVCADKVLNTMHHVKPAGGIYEENLLMSSDYAGFPTQTFSTALPNDQKNNNSRPSYINGSGQLQVYLNGQKLLIDEDYSELGNYGQASEDITIRSPLVTGDILTFRIESGTVYFASSGTTLSLQNAYQTGSSVTIQSGNPISLNASTNTALNITGKLEVTGPLIAKSQNSIRFFDLDNSNYVGLKAPLNLTQDTLWTLPTGDGTSGQVLTTLGNGTLSWSSPSSQSGSFLPITGGELTGELFINDKQTTSPASIKLKERYNYGGNSERYVGLKAPVSMFSSSIDLTLPDRYGTTGQALVATDSSGTLGWTTIPSTSGFLLKAGDTMTGPLSMNSQNEVRFVGSGSTYVGFKAVSNITSNKIWTLPAADGTSGQALVTDGSGALSWSNPSVSGPIYSINNGKSAKIYSKMASDALANKFTVPTNWKNIAYPYNSTSFIHGSCWSPELGIFCAVGTPALIMTSYDGENWTPRTPPNSVDYWQSVCWSPALGIFCAVGRSNTTYNGRIMTSPDGVNWTSRTSNLPSGTTSSQWVSVCWSPELGIFCAVADWGLTNDTRIIYSYDGITWSAAVRSVGTTNTSFSDMAARPLEKVVWSPELNLFVAMSGSGTNMGQNYPIGTGNRSGGTSGAYLNSVLISSDGINWTLQSTSSTRLYDDFCWSSELKKFVAVVNSQNISGYTWTSVDGVNWTETTDSVATFFSRQRINWISELGLFFVIGSGLIFYSSDGVNWSSSASILSGSTTSSGAICWSPELGRLCVSNGYRVFINKDFGFYSSRKVIPKYFYLTAQASEATRVVTKWYSREINANGGNSVCWSPELGLLCSVSSNNASINTSADGITWTNRGAPPIGLQLRSVCWSPEVGRFCAVGYGDNLRVFTSTDGITWSGNQPPELNSWMSVCWSAEVGKFCAVSYDGTNRVMTSSDGLTWTSTGLTGVSANQWMSVCWSSELKLFCAVSANGTNRVMTSADGITWTSAGLTGVSANQWYSVCWSPELGLFCAISIDGTSRVMTSPDGVAWTAQTAAAANQWVSVCWSSELRLFCAVSYDGTSRVMTSPDGSNWTLRSSANDSTSTWYGVCWSPELGVFCSVATAGTSKAMTSKKANLLSEILNLKTSRLYY